MRSELVGSDMVRQVSLGAVSSGQVGKGAVRRVQLGLVGSVGMRSIRVWLV